RKAESADLRQVHLLLFVKKTLQVLHKYVQFLKGSVVRDLFHLCDVVHQQAVILPELGVERHLLLWRGKVIRFSINSGGTVLGNKCTKTWYYHTFVSVK